MNLAVLIFPTTCIIIQPTPTQYHGIILLIVKELLFTYSYPATHTMCSKGENCLGHFFVAVLLLVLCSAHVPRATSTSWSVDYDTIPEWVTRRNNSTMFWREYSKNVAAVDRINKSGKRADVLLIGDSITAWNKPMNLSKLRGSRKVWEKNFGDLISEPLGIPGDRVDDVVWRLAVGAEKPTLDPKVIIIFVGINDVVHKTPNVAERMDFLLGWLRKHSPESRVVVQLLLPSLSPALEVNLDYNLLALRHNATPSSCMMDMKKNDRRFMVDILHPNERGQDRLQKCLRKRFVDKFI